MNRQQVTRYIVVGLASNGTLLALFWVIKQLGVNSLVANGITYLIGIAISLTLNGRWTFGVLSKENFWPVTIRFVLLYIAGLIYSLFAFQLISKLGFAAVVTQLLVMGTCAVLLFFGQKFWVFKVSEQVGQK